MSSGRPSSTRVPRRARPRPLPPARVPVRVLPQGRQVLHVGADRPVRPDQGAPALDRGESRKSRWSTSHPSSIRAPTTTTHPSTTPASSTRWQRTSTGSRPDPALGGRAALHGAGRARRHRERGARGGRAGGRGGRVSEGTTRPLLHSPAGVFLWTRAPGCGTRPTPDLWTLLLTTESVKKVLALTPCERSPRTPPDSAYQLTACEPPGTRQERKIHTAVGLFGGEPAAPAR